MSDLLFENYKNHLQSGKILVYPTETVWGFGVLPTQNKAIEKLSDLKNSRSEDQSYSLLVSDLEMAKKLVYIDSELEKILKIFWPGPVTFILKALDKKTCDNVRGHGFIGLRCSNHDFVKKFMFHLNEPLITTSANKSGEPAATCIGDLGWINSSSDDVMIVDDGFARMNITQDIANSSEQDLNCPTETHSYESTKPSSTLIKIENKNYSILRNGKLCKKKIVEIFSKHSGLSMAQAEGLEPPTG